MKLSNHWAVLSTRLVTFVFLLAVFAVKPGAAQITVTTPNQGVTDVNNCSVQEAIYATQFGANIAIDQTDPDDTYNTGCTDPSGLWYQIVLQQGTTYKFDHFWDGDGHNPFGPTATPVICNVVDIVGNGATLEWTDTGYSRLFAVGYATISPTSGVVKSGTYCGIVAPSLTLQNVYIKGFQVKGGDGTGGGGGGLGAGGAIYIGRLPGKDLPYLTIQNSTFDGNTATGGSGGGCGSVANAPDCNGGGAGLSGAGGTGSALDGGGGGAGARGNGGGADASGGGGGGGGTVFPGGDAHNGIGGAAGLYCGGNGGDNGNDGHNASCAGGGGGAGGNHSDLCLLALGPCGQGGAGAYGGGGGGGGDLGNAGNGGFGGGGGASFCCSDTSGGNGGHGGFGGGGGKGDASNGDANADGTGGFFGGHGVSYDVGGGFGGAGAGLGGAIFNDSASVMIQNSTFANNKVSGGGLNSDGTQNGSCCGTSDGAAIFSRNGSLTVVFSTIAHNSVGLNGFGGSGITVFGDGSQAASFTLQDSIVADNGVYPCFYLGTVADAVAFAAAGNLITDNDVPNYNGFFPLVTKCTPGVATSADPRLGPLQLNAPGNTPTMAIGYEISPAADAGDDSALASYGITTDQRGVTRPQGPHVDIGAYEAVVMHPLTITVSGGGLTSPAPGTYEETPGAVVDVSATAASGSYFLNWSGNVASASSASTTVTMNQPQTITANFQLHDFSLSANPASITVPVGGSGSSAVTVASLGNFADKVSLTASGAPSGFMVSLNPTSLTPAAGASSNSTLSFNAGPSVTPQNFTETVTGTSTGLSGALNHTVQVAVAMYLTAAAVVDVVNEDQALHCVDNSGIAQSLNAKLNAFQTISSAGHMNGAVNVLAAFEYEVQAQTDQHIASSCTDGSGTKFSPAQTLLADANFLLATVGAQQVTPTPILGSVVNLSNAGISGATVNLLNSSNTVIATATTDAVGFYYFSDTSGLTLGATYTVKVTIPSGYKRSAPSAQSFTWRADTVKLANFALN